MLRKMIHPACTSNVYHAVPSAYVLLARNRTFFPKPVFQQGKTKEEVVLFPSFHRLENQTIQRLNN